MSNYSINNGANHQAPRNNSGSTTMGDEEEFKNSSDMVPVDIRGAKQSSNHHHHSKPHQLHV